MHNYTNDHKYGVHVVDLGYYIQLEVACYKHVSRYGIKTLSYTDKDHNGLRKRNGMHLNNHAA